MNRNNMKEGIIGPCMSSMNYKTKNFKLIMDKNYLKDLDIVKELMKANNCKTLDELMEKEMNFNDKELIEKLNSYEFKEKFKNIDINLSGE